MDGGKQLPAVALALATVLVGCNGGGLGVATPVDLAGGELGFAEPDLAGTGCTNGLRDGDETGVDCGGACGPCADGEPCTVDGDCQGGSCAGGKCVTPPSCSDRVKNQGESDVDCGGPCGGCQDGAACGAGNDCLSRHCKAGLCIRPGAVALSFSAPVLYPVGNFAFDVTLGDFDGDGRLDAVVEDNPLDLFRGRGDGTFLPAQMPPVPPYRRLKSADLDRDGRVDLVLAGQGALSVLYGEKAGFSPPRQIPTGDQTDLIAIGDVSGDGWLDVVVAEEGSSGGVVFFGGAGRLLSPGPTFTVSAHAWQGLAAGDLDGDGRADLVAAMYRGAVALRGVVKGALPLVWTEPPPPMDDYMESVALGNFDGDGKLDMVAGGLRPVIKCRLGDGKGGFGAAREFATVLPAPAQRWVVVADFDGDGWDDVAAGQAGNVKDPGAVSVFPGRGDGTFGKQVDVKLTGRLFGLAAGDLDRDGRIDLVGTLTEQDHALVVLRNTSK